MELEEIRKKIDNADAMLLTSFVTRMRITKEVADFKKENGIPVFDEEREKEKLAEVERMAPFDLKEECVELYRTILKVSKEYQTAVIEKSGEGDA